MQQRTEPKGIRYKVKPMKRVVQSCLLFPILALCLSIEYSDTASAENCDLFEKLEAYGAARTAPPDAICSTYLGLSSKIGVSCFWEFPRLSADARLLADLLWARLRNCRHGSPLEKDQPVNHPDTYSLRQLIAGNRVYWISIKDKAHQNRTLVFMRLEKQ